MPITLPPLSRRAFLGRALLTGAGALLGPRAWAATAPVDPHTWALLSDPHIAGDRAKVARGFSMAAQLATVVQDVLAQPQRPAGALVNGDLAFNTGETAVHRFRAPPARRGQGTRVAHVSGAARRDHRTA